MRKREERHSVLIDARMRVGSEWCDVAIRNVSAHGMLMSADRPPKPGSYIEVRRAAVMVIARSVWTDGQQFGIRAQDLIDLQELLGARRGRSEASFPAMERRTERRRSTDETGERSRWVAQAGQFLAAAAVFVAMAWLAASHVFHTLGAPLAAVSASLAP